MKAKYATVTLNVDGMDMVMTGVTLQMEAVMLLATNSQIPTCSPIKYIMPRMPTKSFVKYSYKARKWQNCKFFKVEKL